MYKRKKKFEKRKIILICLLVFCLILGIIANIVTTNRQLTVFEKAIKDGVLMVEKGLQMPFDFIGKKIQEGKEKKQMYEEYKDLKQQLETLKGLSVTNQELEKQIRELQAVLEVNTVLSDYVYTNATVIHRDLVYWNDTITIDKGEHDGVTVDMPVVIKDGLLGKVIQTTTFTSTVRLLTANNASDRVSVKIKNQDDYAYGILSGYDAKDNTYTIEGIAQNIDIEIGSLVTTTGMGDLFPAGIVLGKVTAITTDNFDLAKVLKMKSSVDFDNLTYVTVLKRNDNK